jgi:hypothetical protein
MEYLLFMNPQWGVDFILKRKLENAELEYVHHSIFDGDKKTKKLYTKHGIKSTPVLLKLDKGEVVDKLVTTDEIVEFLKNESNKEI